MVVWLVLATVGPVYSAGFEVLHHFAGTDGSGSDGIGFILDSDRLYGMTEWGGANDLGVVFSIDTDGNHFNLLHEFSSASDDGQEPRGGLNLIGGKLYGTTFAGGGSDLGSVFSMDIDGDNFSLLHEFAGGNTDGANPFAGLTYESGKLYGTTFYGGDFDRGTVFSMNLNGSDFSLLHEFAGGASTPTDGQWPYGSLTVNSGRLYGMTSTGGHHGEGTVFALDVDGSDFSLLHEFASGNDDGENPFLGSLTLDSGKLYGMTKAGGDDGLGVVFSVDTDGNNFSLLHEFEGGGEDGENPFGSLSLNDGKLYGMTAYGGDSNLGVLFCLDVDGSNFSLFHEFAGNVDGALPVGDLILESGKIYGMTQTGGANGDGTIFVIPEPVTLGLLLMGGLVGLLRRGRKANKKTKGPEFES